mmetsp:Transcript_9116/g.29383  ORF Transcript_9116/g.29383 Transcript_9116/m.29383 type:complete len:212 (+) Transcript_9116:654-1289(+)
MVPISSSKTKHSTINFQHLSPSNPSPFKTLRSINPPRPFPPCPLEGKTVSRITRAIVAARSTTSALFLVFSARLQLATSTRTSTNPSVGFLGFLNARWKELAHNTVVFLNDDDEALLLRFLVGGIKCTNTEAPPSSLSSSAALAKPAKPNAKCLALPIGRLWEAVPACCCRSSSSSRTSAGGGRSGIGAETNVSNRSRGKSVAYARGSMML